MKNRKIKSEILKFLKPSLWNVLLFILLILIAFSSMGHISNSSSHTTRALGDTIYNILIVVDNDWLEKFVPSVILLFIELIYLYIISCFIIFSMINIKKLIRKKRLS